MPGERRTGREAHRVAVHVVAHGDEIGECERAFGLERIHGDRRVLRDVGQQRDRRCRMPPGHAHRPAETLTAGRAAHAATEHLGFFRDLHRRPMRGALDGCANQQRREPRPVCGLLTCTPEREHAGVRERARLASHENRHAGLRLEDADASVGAHGLEADVYGGRRTRRHRWRLHRGRRCGVEQRAHRRRVARELGRALGAIDDHARLVGVEIAARQYGELLGRDGERALEVRLAPTPVTQRLPLGEVVGLTFHVLQPSHPVRLVEPLRARNLGVGHTMLAHRAQLRPDGASRVGGPLGRRFGVDDEDPERGGRVVVCGHRRGELSFSHRAIQARGASPREHRREDVERRGVGVERAGRTPAKCHLRLPDVTRPFARTEAGCADFNRSGSVQRRAGGKCAVARLDIAHHVGEVHVADYGEYGVDGTVEVAVEVQHGITRERAQARLTTDAPATDAMPVVQQLV